MTYHNRLPIGAIGDTPSEAPRYVPGPSRSPTPLDTRPLSEASDTLPAPAVVWRPRTIRRHSRLYWLARDLGWWAQEQWDIARYETGWAGQIAVMVLCAVAVVLGVAVGMLALLAAGLR